MLDVLEVGYQLGSSVRTVKASVTSDVAIARKHGCQLMLEKVINKDVNHVTAISFPYIFGKMIIRTLL